MTSHEGRSIRTGRADREAETAVTALAHSCVDALDQAVASAIVHGSLTLDDFQPGRSDLDLLLVVDDALTANAIEALVTVVTDAAMGPAGGIDLLVVTRQTAAAPVEHPRRELQVGRYAGIRDSLEVGSGHDPEPDLWPELSMARAHGRALIGAVPGRIIGEVPPHAVQERGLHWLRTWLDLADDAVNASHMVLTACRIWRFGIEGQHCSKTSAARWAMARDPSLVAVRHALAHRTGAPGAPGTPPAADDVTAVLVTVLRDLGLPAGG